MKFFDRLFSKHFHLTSPTMPVTHFWSFSSQFLLNSCELAWYYQYVLSKSGWEEDADEVEKKAYYLKRLQPIKFIAQQVMETCFLQNIELITKPFDPNKVATMLMHEVKRRIESSIMEKEEFGQVLELHYGDFIDYQELTTEVCLWLENMTKLLKELFPERVTRFKLLMLDKFSQFDYDNTTIFLHHNFACQAEDGKIHIISLTKSQVSLRRLVNALYFEDRFKLSRGQIMTHFIGVDVGDFEATDNLNEVISQYQHQVEQLLHQKSSDMRFKLCQNDKTCGRCRYREICAKFQKEQKSQRFELDYL